MVRKRLFQFGFRLLIFLSFVGVLIGTSLSLVIETHPARVSLSLERLQTQALELSSACQAPIDSVVTPLDQQGRLRVLVWNIYKQQKSTWQQAFQSLMQGNDLLLLQEVRFPDDFFASLQPPWQVSFGHSFSLNDSMSFFKESHHGVMTLARTSVISACADSHLEPWLRLPKASLFSYYSLSNGQTLLAINVHSLNFVWQLSAYQAQLAAVVTAVNAHQGPVIVGGDLNTWRQARLELMDSMLQQAGLVAVQYQQDQRWRVAGLPLDHLYYRQLTLIQANAQQSDGSDHQPIVAEFMLETAP